MRIPSVGSVLSAGEESTLLRHLVAVFDLRAVPPDATDDAGKHDAHEGSVGFPVGGLGVPTTSRRPDVFRVSGE